MFLSIEFNLSRLQSLISENFQSTHTVNSLNGLDLDSVNSYTALFANLRY